MSKTTILAVVFAVVLAGAPNAVAQEREPGQDTLQERQGSGLSQNRPSPPWMSDNWLDKLNKARKQNDRQEIDRLLKEMNEARKRFQRDTGRPEQDRPTQVGLIQNDEDAFNGYTLLAPMGSTDTYLIDNQGRVVNSWKSDYHPAQSAYLLENGHLLRTASLGPEGNRAFHGGGAGGRVEEFDWDGTLLWEFEYASDQHGLHHDIEKLPNGNVLMIAWERKTPKQAIAAGRNPDRVEEIGLWPDHIIEVEPNGRKGGEIVWEWHVWDHLVQEYDPSKENYGVVGDHPELIDLNFSQSGEPLSREERERLEALGYLGPGPPPNPGMPGPRWGQADWNHTNSVAYNAQLDQIALSVLNFNEVWVIDHSTTTEEAAGHSGGRSGKGGDILYRWGNPQAYRAGTPADQQLFAQHDVQWIAPGLKGAGNLLVFNNGRGRPDGVYSSIDELVTPVDEKGRYKYKPGAAFGPDKPVWTYVAPKKTDFWSGHISGAQRLPNGNTLICAGETGTIFEVTEGGKVVWKYINPVAAQGPPGPPGFGPGIRGPGMRRGQPPFPPMLDADANGLVSFKEASVLPFMDREHFKRLDTNGDGTLTREEMPQGPPPGPRGGRMGPPGGPGGRHGGLFKALRYAPDFPGLAGKDLTPGQPIKAASAGPAPQRPKP